VKRDALFRNRSKVERSVMNVCGLLKTASVIITWSRMGYHCSVSRPAYLPVNLACHADLLVQTDRFSAREYKSFNYILVQNLIDLVGLRPSWYKLGHKVNVVWKKTWGREVISIKPYGTVLL